MEGNNVSYDLHVERHIAQARALRAEYCGNLLRRLWAGIPRRARFIARLGAAALSINYSRVAPRSATR